jgi:hypothetical protein
LGQDQRGHGRVRRGVEQVQGDPRVLHGGAAEGAGEGGVREGLCQGFF